MRKGGGKSKGASFERLICKELSLWMSHGKQEDCFWRSSMSGGRSTIAARKGKRLAAQAGDITSINSIGQKLTEMFYVENKFYRDLNFMGILKRNGKLAEFWLETRKQAKQYNKHPMLIAKQNQQPIMVCLSREGLDLLKLPAHVAVPPMGLRIILFEHMVKFARRPE